MPPHWVWSSSSPRGPFASQSWSWSDLKDCALRFELRRERAGVHVLDRDITFDRHLRGYARRVADDHILRLHPKRRIRDVRRRKAHRHKKIHRLISFREYQAIRN